MRNKLFTKEEIEALSKNPYVQSVSPKGITYTDASKRFSKSIDFGWRSLAPKEFIALNHVGLRLIRWRAS